MRKKGLRRESENLPKEKEALTKYCLATCEDLSEERGKGSTAKG